VHGGHGVVAVTKPFQAASKAV